LAAGRGDIPIYPGEAAPLKVPQRQPQAQQAAALPHWPYQEDFPQRQAIEFMRRTIRAHPGEVTLCTIGPLTNIGRLFSQDPEIPALLKGLVMMGGSFTRQPEGEEKTEWNAAGDPHATKIVYEAPLRLHRSLGLDVTQQVMLTEEEVRRRFTAPLLRPVLDFAEIWFAGVYPSITFHDPLTAATIFDPGLCAYLKGNVTIDMEQHPGLTVFHPSVPDSPHQIAVSVDRERYFDHFFGVFN
jgi:inosine-uridine nucleoside N-ribohydrolase